MAQQQHRQPATAAAKQTAPQQLSAYERLEQKSQREQQKEGVQLVRREKQADEATQKKLSEAYRVEQKRFAEKTSARGWKCLACGRMNFDERLACGTCTAVAPHAYPSGTPRDCKGPGVASALDGGETRIVTVAGRSYRAYNSEFLKQQLRPACQRKKKAADNDEATAYAPYDGDAFVGGGPPGSRHQPPNTVMCDEDDEDEPGCPLRVVNDDDDASDRFEAPPAPVMPVAAPQAAPATEQQQPYTHFVSLPLGTIPGLAANVRALLCHVRAVTGLPAAEYPVTTEQAIGSLEGVSPEFTKYVGAACSAGSNDAAPPITVPDEGIESSLLVTPEKFHFTVLMLRLPTRDLVDRAVSVLTTKVKPLLEAFAAKGERPRLHLHGLQTMTSTTPAKTNVLYVELGDRTLDGAASSATPRSDIVQLLRAVRNVFLEASLASDKDVQLGEKIHATLMNSKWRGKKGPRQQQRGRGDRRQPSFDATRILRMLGGVSLGVHQPTTMELSKLDGSRAASGYYAAEAVIAI